MNKNVYDLTSYVSNHPGGASAIAAICGKDGTAAFSGQHGGQSTPTSVLSSFKIGVFSASGGALPVGQGEEEEGED